METFPNVVQEAPSKPLKAPSLPPPFGRGAQRGEWQPSPMQGKWKEFFAKLQASAKQVDASCANLKVSLGSADASCANLNASSREAHCFPPCGGTVGGLVMLEEAPIILELGCGRGEYTVGLARRFPEKCFIGVDIKGARMWHGAREAIAEGLTNAAFLRTNIEFIDRFFAPGEVSEIWLTFSDPQMKKASKRLTSTNFLQRYRRIMPNQGVIHLKTDSNFLFTYTLELLRANGIEPEVCLEDVYGGAHPSSPATVEPSELSLLREVRTYYEQMWLDRGITIKYLRFRLPADGELLEPDVEIPLDEYRSYNRVKRSSKDVGR